MIPSAYNLFIHNEIWETAAVCRRQAMVGPLHSVQAIQEDDQLV